MRDYCPSRREQKKLKAKKVKARKVRRSKKKASLVNWQKLLLVLISLLLLISLGLLLFHLVKNQLIKRHQLSHNYHLLIVDDQRPFAWVVFAPVEEKIKIFDFGQLSEAQWIKEEFNTALSADEQILFYSLMFNTFIDQVIDYAQPHLIADQQDQFAEFLLTELKSRGVKDLLFYLESDQVTWEWLTDDQVENKEEQQRLFTNFLEINTATNYGKLFECPVAVINSSQITGLATVFAQLLEKDGFSVVKRDSGPDILAESSILIDPNIVACQSVLTRFQQLMPAKTMNVSHELTQQYRAGAVIFLAEDLAELRIGAFNFLHDGF